MITMNELVDLRMQQHIAHELYRQQIMQRIPDPFPPLLPIPMPRHMVMPPRVSLPGVEVSLQNDDLWKQFHQIGTEMIITKSGRRMFPSMRLSLSGLDEEAHYCLLLEMVPIGDCRYKFSGSQWVPAGGAEPQSPQRMCLHPDNPASGAHWQAQPILFNKVKLTNNTLDSSGHIVLASMHKYQPRIHIICTSDLTQIPWAPQQAFVFPETEFVAVTAYQNDRITKLKIDNNPFAKGFRETGQSRCKRKMSSSPSDEEQESTTQQQQHEPEKHSHHPPTDMSPTTTKSTLTTTSDSASSICSDKLALQPPRIVHMTGLGDVEGDVDVDSVAVDAPQIKRMRSNGSACSITSSSLDEPNIAVSTGVLLSSSLSSLSGETSLPANGTHEWSAMPPTSGAFMQHFQHTLLRPSLVDLACTYFGRPQTFFAPLPHGYREQQEQHDPVLLHPVNMQLPLVELPNRGTECNDDVERGKPETLEMANRTGNEETEKRNETSVREEVESSPPNRKKGFSISAILGGS